MRSVVKNEQGYALIIVLLIIVIIAIMTPPIVSKILSSSSQFQEMEEDLQLEKLSNMGILYTEKAIDKAESEADKAGGDAVRFHLLNFDEDNLPRPYEELVQVYRTAFINEFEIIMKSYFISEYKKVTDDPKEFKGVRSIEMVVKEDVNEVKVKSKSYKYQVVTKIDPELPIEYCVYMTVTGNYNMFDRVEGSPRSIEIKYP